MFRYGLVILLLFAVSALIFASYSLKLPSRKILLWLAAILLLGMLIVDGILTTLPIVGYNSSSILGLKLGSIPIEDFGYLVVVILLGPALFEFFSHEKRSK